MTATDTAHAALIEELCLIRQEHENGTVIYRNHLGEIHRVHGPAEVWPDGTQYWVQNGLPHRTDGPAAIFADGTEIWYRNGVFHRTNGPAVIYPNGECDWYQNGSYLRTDGDATDT